MKGLFGPSIMDLVKEKRRYEAEAPLDEDGSDTMESGVGGAPPGWGIEMKRKRRTLLMKKMLTDAGYNDIARMVNIKERQ